jgi:catechol 2,3-dioxygenase-like lactoylglutathione lyase family enzyme
MSLTVRLACSAFARSLRFYTDVLGFTTLRYEPEYRRAELEREGVLIEIAEYNGEGLASLEYPFGRGVTLIVWTQEAESVYAGVEAYGARLHKPMAQNWREENGLRLGHVEFEVIDPDGYALRFCEALPPGAG